MLKTLTHDCYSGNVLINSSAQSIYFVTLVRETQNNNKKGKQRKIEEKIKIYIILFSKNCNV